MTTITSIIGTAVFFLIGFIAAYIARSVLSIVLLGGLLYGSLKALETEGQKTEFLASFEKIIQHGKAMSIGLYDFLNKLISHANDVCLGLFLTGCLLGLFISFRRRV